MSRKKNDAIITASVGPLAHDEQMGNFNKRGNFFVLFLPLSSAQHKSQFLCRGDENTQNFGACTSFIFLGERLLSSLCVTRKPCEDIERAKH